MTSCLDKALQLVARRPHFRRELAEKLTRRGFPAEEIGAVLGELDRQGWIDDASHALDLAQGPLSRKDYGPRRMRHELRRRGVDDDLAERVIAEVFSDPDEEIERGRRAVARSARGDAVDPDRLARQLDRKGYSKAVIVRLLGELSDG